MQSAATPSIIGKPDVIVAHNCMASDAPLQLVLLPNVQSKRLQLLQRWHLLMNEILPHIAKQNNWPILQNHCFMRVCLDTSLGAPWYNFVRQPASRHMTDTQFQAAIAVAEQIVETPTLLPELNRQSIERRKQTSC
jgi:hypothetical protein